MLSSSERKRIREVRRYYKRSPDDPPIAGESVPAESPETVRSVEKASSPNSTLTALMQLITWRLGASRAMVSVVDDNAQYFLAEATKTLDLSDSSKHDPGDDLWMGCGGTIRSQALCAYTIEVIPEPNHYACFSVPDLSADPRFCNLPYVAGGPNFRYYAGTPLISNTGIPIGSVFVIDPRPRKRATRAEVDFLGLMAKNVMEYLEMKRESVQLRRNDVMSKGLAALVEGQSKIPRQLSTEMAFKCQDPNGSHSNGAKMVNTNLTSNFVVVDTSLATVAEQSLNSIAGPPHTLVRENLLHDISPDTSIDQLALTDAPATHDRILSRGANLLRESLDVDYTIFFDMSIGFSSSVVNGQSGDVRLPEDTFLDETDTKNDFTTKPVYISHDNDIDLLNTSAQSSSLSRRSNEAGSAKVRSFSTSTCSSLDGDTLSGTLYRAPNEKDLQRLSKRYPKGKVWTFNGYDSESSEDDDLPPSKQMFAMQLNPQDHRVRKSDRSIVRQCFPDAREVLFAPLSEAGTGLPIVACFAVSLRDIAIFTSDTEKAFVRGFLNSVSIEYNRISIAAADRQKGDFISSISHLNNSMKHKEVGVKAPDTNGNSSNSQQINGESPTSDNLLSHPLDLARMCEDSVAIVAVAYMHHRTNSEQLLYRVMQPPGTMETQEIQTLYESNSVTVSLHIAFGEWHFFCSPGSMQRIIMNLVGNSLKYTSAGFIDISLALESPKNGNDKISKRPNIASDDLIVLRVSDSGKGISSEFLKSKLFIAFSQESSLAPGTGLGLHIVYSLVRMYNGTIDVQSQIGHGTTVTVKLPLKRALSNLTSIAPSDPLLKVQVEELKILLKQFKYCKFSTHGFRSGSSCYLKKSLHAYLTQWFGMNHDPDDDAADIAFVTEQKIDLFLAELMKDGVSKPSLIIVVRYVPSHNHTSQQNSAIGIPLETLTIPFGPWKLLKTLRTCLSPKQISPKPSPVADHKILYTSPLPSPHADIRKELGTTVTRTVAEEALTEKSLSVPKTLSNPSQPTILCVDDNAINLRLLRAYFRKLNFDITCAENGAVAFEKYRLQPNGYDLVFMDISMPICDGYQSTRMIRSLDKLQQSISPTPLPATRIVAISAAYSDADMEMAKAAGIDDFYTKPMKVSRLETLMKNWGYLDT
ncbi:putative two-component sensor protein histidine protein kinase (dhkj) protein [Botrytis cinerea BcDW1]|uniref:Putative two-component sensor protein histidine protein kinase ( dhkj) protein n=1 Tax=Botryotinia fuckeliana (strain BcDW1) TaxID=1290391 RepID=M7U4K9_BOTF1|nr:putative two-component sensor protein histidine protein kinase (dhkj) protein [Botrytis cinerea BcDW1]